MLIMVERAIKYSDSSKLYSTHPLFVKYALVQFSPIITPHD